MAYVESGSDGAFVASLYAHDIVYHVWKPVGPTARTSGTTACNVDTSTGVWMPLRVAAKVGRRCQRCTAALRAAGQ